MGKVAILTDTNSGFTMDEAKQAGVFLLPMPFYVDGELKYEGIDLSQDQFFEALRKDADVSTSMPIVGDVIAKWEELLKDHDEVVYIPMSSGLSSSCETARMLAEDFEGRVQVADNHRISVTMKLSVFEAKALADEGKSAVEIRQYLESHMSESSIYIMVDTLKYLRKGGRLTPAVAAIGTILHIKPVLQIQGGKLDTFAKARTLQKSKQIMLDAIVADNNNRFNSPNAQGQVMSIAHTDNIKEAEIFREEAMRLYPDKKFMINPLALSIACHIGAGALAITTSKSFIKEI